MKCPKFYIFIFIIMGFINSAYAQKYKPNNIPICTNASDQSEPAIAIDPNNNSHLFSDWNDFRNLTNSNVYWHIGYGFSQNDLNLWSTNLLVNTTGQFEGGFDPSVSFDKNSNVYLCFIASNSGLGPVYIAKTQNNGISWYYYQVSPLSYSQDKPYMTMDNSGGNYNGRIYISWTDFSSGSRILTSFSSDNGLTWSTPNQISSSISKSAGLGVYLSPQYSQYNVQSAFVQGSIPAIAQNGNVYIVYLLANGGNGSSGKIKICKSTNGGLSYFSPITIADISVAWKMQVGHGLRASSLPTIDIDPQTGNIYVAYTQNDNGDLNIYYTYSTDGGSTWSSPQIATQNTNDYQFFPWLSISSEGLVSLVYYQGTSSSVNIYIAESYNSGLSFYSPNTKISSISSNPNNVANSSYTSDYIGMSSAKGYNFYPSWTDFRNGNADVYIAKYNSLDKLSYENKSLYIASTFPNSSRQLQKGGGKLHEIFASGGEVFYRRSANNGSTWELTKRLSTGNGSNGRQCIAIGHDGNIYVVWQRKIGSNSYEIWYTGSENNGTTWSTPKIITGSDNVSTSWAQSAGVMPVISEIEMTPQDHEIVVVYCSSQGLKYSISESDENPGASWSTPQVISGSHNSYVEFPSLAKGQGFLSLTYDYRYYGVYSRTFNGSTWSSETYISNYGTIEDRYSSVSIDGNNDIIAAWCAQENVDSDYRILFRYGYSNNTWSNWKVEFDKIPGISSYYPAITYYNKGGSNNYGVAIVYHTSDKQIRIKKYDVGTVWYDYTVSNSGRYANITTEDYNSGTPKYIWTDQNGSPYTVSLSSQHLPKKLLAMDGIRKRRAVFTDTLTKSSLCFQVGDLRVRTRQGEEIPIYFKRYNHRDKLKLDLKNICSYISSEPILLPPDAKSISFTDTIYTTTINDSSNSDVRQVFTNYSYALQLVDAKTGKELCILDNGKSSGLKAFDIGHFAGKEVRLKPEIKIFGISLKSLEFGLVDIISPVNFSTPKIANNKDQWEVRPEHFDLFQNYPNPFNPTTTISYQLPEAARVTVGIYNLQGRLVETLVNGEKEAGSYSVKLNAANLPSGVYFYRIQAGKFTATKKLLLLK